MPVLNPQDILTSANALFREPMSPSDRLRLALLDRLGSSGGGGGGGNLGPGGISETSLMGWWMSDTLGGAGSNVTAWTDSSGNGNTLTNENTAPTVIVNRFSPLKGVLFNGVTRTLAHANIFGAGTNCTIFAVYATNALGVYGVAGQSTFNGSGDSNTMMIQSRNDLSDPYWTSFQGDINSGVAQAHTIKRCTGFTLNGTTIDLYDKTTVKASATRAENTGGTAAFRLGGTFATQEFFAGEIAEVIAYKRTLSAGEISTMVGYLVSKYGIP